MHLLDCYSLNCGLKIEKPFILEKFFPLDIDRFITFEPKGMFPSRQYDYWEDCLDILKPIFEKHDIKILQIGLEPSDLKFSKVFDISGQINQNQQAYVINKAELHLGVDSFSNHLASFFNKKIVSLFSDSPPANSGPLFGDENDACLMTPTLKEGQFSYSAEEQSKVINSIKAEDIAKNVCEALNLPFYYEYETVHIGADYLVRSVEFIPIGNAIDAGSLNIDSLIVRMDLQFDEIALAQQLQVCNCSIVTEKPISTKLLSHFKNKIHQFVYIIGEHDSKQYVNELYNAGIQCMLMSEKEGEELNKLKFKYLDFGKIHARNTPNKKDLEFLKAQDLDNLYYRSSKFLIKEGQTFYGRAALDDETPTLMLGSKDLHKVIR